jgi:hypothetical protein
MAASIRAFISYSWIDKPLARRLARRLRHAGIDVFLDETHLDPGTRLPDSLKREIARSSHVLVVWTPAAAASEWVAQEVEYATTAEPRPTLIPLLFMRPVGNPVIVNTVGVDFSMPHRFERGLDQLWSAIGHGPGEPPGREVLSADLAATVGETPSISKLLDSPIDRAVTAREVLDVQLRQVVSPDDPSTLAGRDGVLARARDAFKSWKPGQLSVGGLPTADDPDFHALDFATWCAACIALRKTDELKPLVAPEVKTYPGIFAKVLAATGAGFEAILVVLARFPGFAIDPMLELVKADQIREASLAPVVELYDAVFQRVAGDEGRDQFMPFACAERFLFHNRTRLTEAQKRVFLRLVDINGNGPYPGGPLDLLGTLHADAAYASEVLDRILYWVENGFFDRADPARRSESPRLFYGFTAGLIEQGAPDRDVQKLLDAATERIRKHFRAANTAQVLLAMQWLADADRLPAERRTAIERGFQEGVYSSEFEGWPHAARVEPLARELAETVLHHGHRVSAVKAAIRAELGRSGLPDNLL